MTAQEVVIRFIGVDAGLSASAQAATANLTLLNQATDRLAVSNIASSRELTALATALGTNYKQAQQFAAGLGETDRAVTSLSQKMKGAAAATGLTAAKTNEAIGRLRELNKAGADNTAKFQALNKELGVTSAQFEKLNKAAASSREGLLGVGVIAGGLGLAIGAAFGKGIQTFANFDSAIRTFAAITESTGTPALAGVRAEIERLGIATQKTPQEIAQVAIELGKAGFTAVQVKAALEGVVLGSQATGESLARLGEVIGAVINQFQLTATDSGKISDLLVATSNASAAGVNDLGEALSYVGTTAKASNQDFKTVLLLLGQLANAGLKGSIAGTGLAEAMRRIKLASANASTELEQLRSRGAVKAVAAFQLINQQVRDASGQLLPFPQILEKLKVGLASVDQVNKDLVLDALFGVQGGRVVQALIGGAAEQTNNLSKALDNAEGSASRTSEQLVQGLSASFTLFQSSLSVASQRVGEFASVGLEPLVRGASEIVKSFLLLPAPIQSALIAVVGFTGVLAAAVAAIAAYNLVNGAYLITTTRATAAQLLETAQTTAATVSKLALAAVTEAVNFANTANLAILARTALAQGIQIAQTKAVALAQGIATAAQILYAAVTGTGTAAIVAQTEALIAEAAAFAVVAAPMAAAAVVAGITAASIALVANTYNQATEAGNKLRSATEAVDEALKKVDQANQAAARSSQALSQETGTEATRNFEKLKSNLNIFSQTLDKVITGLNRIVNTFSLTPIFKELAKFEQIPKPIRDFFTTIGNIQFKASTILEASATQYKEAFNGAIDASTETLNRFKELDPSKATKDQLAAIDEALKANITNLEATRPTVEGDITRRNLQVEALKKAQASLTQTTTATTATTQATQASTKATTENADALKAAAQVKADALKEQRQEQSTQQQQGFTDQSAAREQRSQDVKQAKEQRFQDAQAAKEQRFKDAQQAAEQQFNALQQAAEQRFKDSEQAAEQQFKDAQQADEAAFNDAQQQREAAFNASQQQAQAEYDARKQAAQSAFNESERLKDQAAKAVFDARQKEIDRKLQLEFAATPEDKAKLEAQFKQEDAVAKRRAQLERGLKADEAAYDLAKQQREAAFKAAQQAADDKFKAEQQAKDLAFKAEQAAADAAYKLQQQESDRAFATEKQTAERAFKAEQDAADAAFKAQQQNQERAFKAQQQNEERAFKASERESDRAFKAQQIELERAFKEQQRQLDLANAQQIKAIVQSAKTPSPIGNRFTGGTMAAGLPYWVGEGSGGRILPTSEIIVPGVDSYAIAANQARTWLNQASAGNANAELLAEVKELRAAITSRDPRVELQAVFPPSDERNMDKYLRTQRAIIRSMV